MFWQKTAELADPPEKTRLGTGTDYRTEGQEPFTAPSTGTVYRTEHRTNTGVLWQKTTELAEPTEKTRPGTDYRNENQEQIPAPQNHNAAPRDRNRSPHRKITTPNKNSWPIWNERTKHYWRAANDQLSRRRALKLFSQFYVEITQNEVLSKRLNTQN